MNHSKNNLCGTSNRPNILERREETSPTTPPDYYKKENGIQETGTQAADDTIYSGRVGSINAQYALRTADNWALECGTFSQADTIVICISSEYPKYQ